MNDATHALRARRAVVARHIGHIERLISSTPAADRAARERLLDEHYAEAAALDAALADCAPPPTLDERPGEGLGVGGRRHHG